MHMKILKQLAIILALCLAAEWLVSLLPIAFPSSVMAILILALLLVTGLLREEQIQETADFMLSNMALVFVPISIGMIEDLELLSGRAAGFLLVVVISLLLTFLGTYITVFAIQKCMKALAGKKTDKGGTSHD